MAFVGLRGPLHYMIEENYLYFIKNVVRKPKTCIGGIESEVM